MIADNPEELLTAVFYLMREHKPVDVEDLAMRLMSFEVGGLDGGKMFFCHMAAQALLREMRAADTKSVTTASDGTPLPRCPECGRRMAEDSCGWFVCVCRPNSAVTIRREPR